MTQQYAIRRKSDGALFSSINENKLIFNNCDPWVYRRECDALFAMACMDDEKWNPEDYEVVKVVAKYEVVE